MHTEPTRTQRDLRLRAANGTCLEQLALLLCEMVDQILVPVEHLAILLVGFGLARLPRFLYRVHCVVVEVISLRTTELLRCHSIFDQASCGDGGCVAYVRCHQLPFGRAQHLAHTLGADRVTTGQEHVRVLFVQADAAFRRSCHDLAASQRSVHITVDTPAIPFVLGRATHDEVRTLRPPLLVYVVPHFRACVRGHLPAVLICDDTVLIVCNQTTTLIF